MPFAVRPLFLPRKPGSNQAQTMSSPHPRSSRHSLSGAPRSPSKDTQQKRVYTIPCPKSATKKNKRYEEKVGTWVNIARASRGKGAGGKRGPRKKPFSAPRGPPFLYFFASPPNPPAARLLASSPREERENRRKKPERVSQVGRLPPANQR